MRLAKHCGILSAAFAVVLYLTTAPAIAACSNPAGNAGDVEYSSIQNIMAYCNGTSWVSMGATSGFSGSGTANFVPLWSNSTTLTNSAFFQSGSNIGIGTTAPLVSFDLHTETDALALPTGSTGQEPASPLNGMIRYNTTIGDLEAFIAGAWTSLTTGGSGGSSTISSGTQYQLGYYATTGSTISGDSNITTDANNDLIISIGKVGIGTSSPGALLTVGNNAFEVNGSGTVLAGTWNGAAVGPTFGGTGLTAYATGDIIYASAANTLSRLAAGINGNVLTLAGGVPTWAASTGGVTSFSAGTTGLTPNTATTGAIVLSGTLGVANGGTGLSTLTSNVIYKGNGTGALATSGLTDNGTIVSSSESVDVTSKAVLMEIANAGTTGTTLNALAKLNTSGAAVIAATADTDGMLGVVMGGAGTTGNAQIAAAGQASCIFDGATTSGDFVTISTTTAGDCHDAGAARPSGQTVGRVLSTNASAGTYAMTVSLNGAAGAGVPNGTIAAFASTSCPTGWTVYAPSVGRFLRGIDTAANTSDTQNRAPGSTETDTFQGHLHSAGFPSQATVSGGGSSTNTSPGGNTGPPVSDGTNGTPRTGLETRPVNVAVTFCQYQGGSGVVGNVGTLTSGDFCTSNGTAISCTTPSTGSNNVVLSASPTVTGTLTAAAANFSGNIGIGTTAPLAPFQMRVGTNQNLTISSDGSVRISAVNDAGNANVALHFQSTDYHFVSGGGASEFITILSSGNVGIGTTAPRSALDVKGALSLEGATSGFSALQSPATAGNVTWTLPSADGTNGQALVTNGSGTLSWAAAGAGSAGSLLRQSFFTTAGSSTWTKGVNTNKVLVYVVSGAGGSGGPSSGSTGGSSSFGGLVSATGGSGGSSVNGSCGVTNGSPGTGSGGDINLSNPASFGSWGFGNSGSPCASTSCGYGIAPGSIGGTGGFALKLLSVTGISTATVTVGAGGSGCINGNGGMVWVQEYN